MHPPFLKIIITSALLINLQCNDMKSNLRANLRSYVLHLRSYVLHLRSYVGVTPELLRSRRIKKKEEEAAAAAAVAAVATAACNCILLGIY